MKLNPASFSTPSENDEKLPVKPRTIWKKTVRILYGNIVQQQQSQQARHVWPTHNAKFRHKIYSDRVDELSDISNLVAIRQMNK